MMRVMLYEAAQSMLRFEEMVLAQGLGDADRQATRDEKRQFVALARRLAVVCTASGVTAPKFLAGPGRSWQHDKPC